MSFGVGSIIVEGRLPPAVHSKLRFDGSSKNDASFSSEVKGNGSEERLVSPARVNVAVVVWIEEFSS